MEDINLCTLCGKDFVSEKLLDLHVKKYHDSRVFQCEICNLEFIGRQKLSEHKRVHSLKTKCWEPPCITVPKSK